MTILGQPHHPRLAAGTLAAFAAVVAVAAAHGPAPATPPADPTHTAVVVSADAPPGPLPEAAVVRRVGGALEAQGVVLALLAHGYGAVIGVGPDARAAVGAARDGGVA
ncbi:hypothetical protein NBH00_10400 [Paraconexibacter antarcticus]|uniref:Uncharacterized protein n=1 Tax=Paraconexibacter antarcticus TaxID=2949664 RepID=A0ABY5E1A9_9ACTN|nr:hypothetical protein [Paraconexibacter antarcticus]UTI66600.1 hypothetical protein NBH00_10400 [Paraconexibacter antarcticus]